MMMKMMMMGCWVMGIGKCGMSYDDDGLLGNGDWEMGFLI